MQTHNLIQGTPEWIDHRRKFKNASDSPVVMGESKHKTRSQLLHEMHTGIVPQVDAATQYRFDEGHRFEALARPLAEKELGEALSPVTGTEGEFGASFDGITFDDGTIWEHKTLNDALRGISVAHDLPIYYRIQMEHQLMVSGAQGCLFSATKWDGETLVEEMHCFYFPDPALRARIVAAWKQFDADLAEYTPPAATAEVTGKEPEALPALRIEITGMVTASNLAEFKAHALAVFGGIKTDLQTDQDFADAEKAVKFCKDAEDRLDAAKQHALSQTASIDELFRTIDSIKKASSEVRLKLDRLVKSEKENRKIEIASKAATAFAAHVRSLEAETLPIRLTVPRPDFGAAMKSMKKLSAMQEAVDTVLRNAMFEADAVAKDVRGKLAIFKPYAEFDFLFRDLQTIIQKPLDDFMLIVETRINQHKAAEAAKLEAERTKIRQEEEAKATAKAEAERKAAEAKPEPIAEKAPEPAKPEELRAAVVEHQDEIAEFLRGREMPDDMRNKVRAYLVEFVKFQKSRSMRVAA